DDSVFTATPSDGDNYLFFEDVNDDGAYDAADDGAALQDGASATYTAAHSDGDKIGVVVTYNNTDANCSDTAVTTAEVYDNPTATLNIPTLDCFSDSPGVAVLEPVDKTNYEFRLVVKGQSGSFADYVGPYTGLLEETDYVITIRDKTTLCEKDYEFKTGKLFDVPLNPVVDETPPTCDSYDGSTYYGSIEVTNHIAGYSYAVISLADFNNLYSSNIENIPLNQFTQYPNATAIITNIPVGEYVVVGRSSDGCLSGLTPAELIQPECMTCETAFAKRSDTDAANRSYCFINETPDDTNASYDLEIDANRWGWTNFISISEFTDENNNTFTMELWAAAGQCDINKGTLVGQVKVVYENGEVSVSYEMLTGYWLGGMHTYVGQEPYMWKQKGKNVEYTLAPGQYPFNSDGGEYTYSTTIEPITVQGVEGFYVIAHADVCTTNTEEYNDRLLAESEPINITLNKRIGTMVYSPDSGGGKPQKSTASTSLAETSDPLFSVAPVPFYNVLNIGYLFDYTSDVTIQVFDLNGRLLATYYDTAVNADSISSFSVDFRTKSNQIYILRMTTDREVYSAKIIAGK
ncbi:T9SS type A sorting domain-containing protein, partial [Christiangramia sp. SM2212]